MQTVTDFIFLGFKKTLAAWKEGYDKPRQYRRTNEPLDEGQRESEKAGLILNIKKLRSQHLVPSDK